MAKDKYFHVTRKSDGSEHLVRATKDSDAVAAVASSRWKVGIATNEDIERHYAAGGSLHEKSVGEEKGTRFILLAPAHGEGDSILIRAKNVAAAVDALSDGDIVVKLADQGTLVRLLEAKVQVIAVKGPEPKAKAAPAAAGNGADDGAGGASNDANGASGQTDNGESGEQSDEEKQAA